MRLTIPPPALRRARLDNLALVPGSLLRQKEQWQALANHLPQAQVLIVLPTSDTPMRCVLDTVRSRIEAQGYRVTTVAEDALALPTPSAFQLDVFR